MGRSGTDSQMMSTRFVVCSASLALYVGLSDIGARSRLAAASLQTSSSIELHGAILRQYCVTCHNQRLKTAGLTLDALNLAAVPAAAPIWEKVVKKLRS